MTFEIALVFAVLGATVVLFVAEWVRVDVVALLVLLALAWLGLVEPREALAGFSSNAVLSIIAVMILGHGVDRTGVMNRLTRPLLRLAGASEGRLVGLVMGAVGLLSAFMQNIGAAALFLPALLRLSKQRQIPASRVLMPVGFAAILGGTLTMVASGPLIVLNDLLRQGGQEPFPLFSVTPVGALLLVAGIGYFLALGRWVLPSRGGKTEDEGTQRELIEQYQLATTIHGSAVTPGSDLVDQTVEQAALVSRYGLNLLALRQGGETQEAPWRQTRFTPGQDLALLGRAEDFQRFLRDHALSPLDDSDPWLEELQSASRCGFAEFVVRPHAPRAGSTLRQLALRKEFGIEPLTLLTGEGEQLRDFSDVPLRPGSALVAHGTWERLRALGRDESFWLLTPIEPEANEPGKGWLAITLFAFALGLAVAGFPLSISLLTGATAMILTRVVPVDAAYRAVDWRTVFLLAGLIPLGTAMEKSGAAAYVAGGMTQALAGSSVLLLLAAVALLTTLFSLFMSNVAATVLLVPLVLVIGPEAGVDGRALALLVAVCASNSFALPTHQVNALFMSPGGYRNADFLRAGGIMTLLFLVIAVVAVAAFVGT